MKKQHILRAEWIKWRSRGKSKSLDAEEKAVFNGKYLQNYRQMTLLCLQWKRRKVPEWTNHRGGPETQVRVLVAQSRPTLCDPMDCRSPGFSVHGILQARILEWVAISFFRDQTQRSPTLQMDSLQSEPPGKLQCCLSKMVFSGIQG